MLQIDTSYNHPQNSSPNTPSTLQMAYEMGACSTSPTRTQTSNTEILNSINATMSDLEKWKEEKQKALDDYKRDLEGEEEAEEVDEELNKKIKKWEEQVRWTMKRAEEEVGSF